MGAKLWQNSTQHPLAGRIKKIQSRLFDLLPVVRNHVYHPRFGGSFSLKYVLPALVPDMTYEGMEVADGTDAGLAWESLIRGGLDQTERDRIRKALLDYCGQDTLALVRLLEKLQTEVNSLQRESAVGVGERLSPPTSQAVS
jgi:predicted RecB family nuclease